MKSLKISVIVPCYNAEKYIGETLDSILSQSHPDKEIVVVNDGSTDGTKAVLETYLDQIRYVEIENTGGPSRPRNIGIETATGDLIAFCDSDDIMLPGKLANAHGIFVSKPSVDVLFTDFETRDMSGNLITARLLDNYQGFREFLEPQDEEGLSLLEGGRAYSCLLRGNFIGTSSVVCRSGVFSRVEGFDQALPNSEDIDLWCRMAQAGHTFAFLDAVQHRYRIHTDSISHGGSRLYRGKIHFVEKHRKLCSDPEDLAYLEGKLNRFWLGYGYALRAEGRAREAKDAYRSALGQRLSWLGIRGWIISAMGLVRGRG